MEISKEEYYSVPEYADDVIIDMSHVDACGESLLFTDELQSNISTINTSTMSSWTTNSDNDISIMHEGKPMYIAETINELTMQVQVMAEMLQEMAASGKFDVADFDMDRRLEQKRMINRLSGD